MFDSNWFVMFCLFCSFLACCATAMALNAWQDSLFDEEPPKHSRREPSPRRGLPDDASLRDLARTYLEIQHRHWPQLVAAGVLPTVSDEAINMLANTLKRHFLDKGSRPYSQGWRPHTSLSWGRRICVSARRTAIPDPLISSSRIALTRLARTVCSSPGTASVPTPRFPARLLSVVVKKWRR